MIVAPNYSLENNAWLALWVHIIPYSGPNYWDLELMPGKSLVD
jgi:hypothetical protein